MARRTEWHKSEGGCWSLSLGVRGCRVRVFQRRPGAVYERVTWIPERGRSVGSLRTTSRPEAERRAAAFLQALLATESTPPVATPLTLGDLWNRYQQEASTYRQNTERTRAQKRAQAQLLLAAVTASKRVDHLTRNDVDRYVELRSTGHGWPDGNTRPPVRARTIASELGLLRTMLLWATRERLPDGSWLLAEYPLRDLKLPREENPRRPVATYERFVAVREAMRQASAAAPQQRGKDRWLRIELALVIAEATGARIGAIRGLRWSDLSFDPSSIRWRPEFDKRGRERVVPMPESLAAELRSFKVRLAVVGDGWLFPRAHVDLPWPRELFGQLLDHAERKAGVPKLLGGRWHPYRRKWAIERKPNAVSDVMAAGGWKDVNTLLMCYQLATEDGMLEVMSSPVKLVSRKAGGKP